MKSALALVSLLVSLAVASPIQQADASASASASAHAGPGGSTSTSTSTSSSSSTADGLPRLIVYFQTTHDSSGRPISMLPLVQEKNIALTHLIVCSLHINQNSEVHLNDYPPSDARFQTLWNETAVLKRSGVRIMGMVGGAASGSFTTNTLDGDDATFQKYYGQLKDIIQQFGLEGMDLDVEQSMSQQGITRLVQQLYSDFGSGFTITLAPVSSALTGGANLSGFNYKTLENSQGSKISFYNGQFYSGFGSMASPSDYEAIINDGYPASKIVAGQLTSPNNGYGYIPYSELNNTVITLRDKYGQIGGVMGWEYFNSLPGGTNQPWEWAQIMTEILRPDSVPKLQVSHSDAKRLQTAYDHSSVSQSSSHNGKYKANKVDYMAMINA